LSFKTDDLITFIQQKLQTLADASKAGPMAAYLKTDMPFYGVQKPDRVPVYKEMKKRFRPLSQRNYEEAVLALWSLPHREEKYAAITFSLQNEVFITTKSLPLYERLIREGAWWDLVDGVASDLVGRVLLEQRRQTRPVIEQWIDDDDVWIRRTAIIVHLGHKEQTDARQLFDHCLRRAHEKEFFIRKAIGWALREYSKTAPEEVRDFLIENREVLSGLSFREGAKRLVKAGLMQV
jgi:3-methyladenine DNA glycosylase AlkD